MVPALEVHICPVHLGALGSSIISLARAGNHSMIPGACLGARELGFQGQPSWG